LINDIEADFAECAFGLRRNEKHRFKTSGNGMRSQRGFLWIVIVFSFLGGVPINAMARDTHDGGWRLFRGIRGTPRLYLSNGSEPKLALDYSVFEVIQSLTFITPRIGIGAAAVEGGPDGAFPLKVVFALRLQRDREFAADWIRMVFPEPISLLYLPYRNLEMESSDVREENLPTLLLNCTFARTSSESVPSYISLGLDWIFADNHAASGILSFGLRFERQRSYDLWTSRENETVETLPFISFSNTFRLLAFI
jgi:hypothetical protein